MRSTIIDLDVCLHWQTEKAIKVSTTGDDGDAEWLSKHIVEYDKTAVIGDDIIISLPRKTAEEKGLI